MSKIITIYDVHCSKGVHAYETGDGFALEPWGHNTDMYEGWDDGGKPYILPDGFELCQCKGGSWEIYRDGATQPEIFMTDDGRPAIMTDYMTGAPQILYLEPASSEEVR